MTKTSRLWRVLGATEPLFEIFSPDLPGTGILRDHDIHSISIDAGTTMAGLSTSAAEVSLRGNQELDYSSDKPVRIELSLYGRTLLAGPLGVSADSIRRRFDGRIAGQKITDKGENNLTTTLTAQDWAAFISQVEVGGFGYRDDPSVWRLYRSLFDYPNIAWVPAAQSWGSTWHWVKWDDPNIASKLIPTSDIIGKYAEDLGNLLSVSRDGTPRAWSHDHLVALADQWRDINPHPLQRSQVLKPVEWSRPVSIPIQLQWRQWQEIGSTNTILWTFPPPNDIAHKVEVIDMLHIWDIHATPEPNSTTGLADVMGARVMRETRADLAVEKVTLDLLMLFERNQGTDRALVGQVLKMTHGDPIVLARDWPYPVNGVYFAKTIAHTITPRSWTVELALMPTMHVTGHATTSDLAGQTWDTAYPGTTSWDEPSTTWEESP